MAVPEEDCLTHLGREHGEDDVLGTCSYALVEILDIT
jgi:hypothetical protein